MIKNSTQNWSIGQTVNVGFLKGFLVVAIHDVKDGMPDIYTLIRAKKVYEFIPHNGLTENTKLHPCELCAKEAIALGYIACDTCERKEINQ